MSNDPQKMLARLKGATTTSLATQHIPETKTTEELAEQSQQTGQWNRSMLSLTRNLVRAGKSDAEIHAITDALTTSDHTVAQTRKQVQAMADGARAKPLGKFHPNTANVYAQLTETDRWSKVFAFDEFNNTEMVISKPPWQTGDPKYFKPRPLKDTDYTQTQIWLQSNWANVSKNAVVDAVNAACEKQIISPVRHYLEQLPESNFDIHSFFETYFGVVPRDENEREYIREASRVFLTQACARAVNAGCKADMVVVLEGKQGIGKSTGLRALFSPDWFKDSLPPMSHKDASDYIVGAWCIELAEMAYQKKAEIEQQKAFLSRQEEKYRPAYKRTSIVYKRRCVFVATTNREDWAVDETGNRRYLPVKTQNIDVAGLKRDRDMIWAAAYSEYMWTKHWWLQDQFIEYTHQQTELRREADLWSELVQEHLAHENEVTIKEAFELCFPQDSVDTRPNPKQITQQDQRRMANCLIAAGFERNGKFSSGKQRNQVRFTRASG